MLYAIKRHRTIGPRCGIVVRWLVYNSETRTLVARRESKQLAELCARKLNENPKRAERVEAHATRRQTVDDFEDYTGN